MSENERFYTALANDRGKRLDILLSECFDISRSLAAKHIGFDVDEWIKVIEKTVPPKTIELNKKAFSLGYNA